MSSPPPPPSSRLAPAWFVLALGAYTVLELSFNHHLMLASSAALPDPLALRDLEFWARVISGLGLSLWLMRWALRRGLAPLLLVPLSLLVGITLMWHLQRWLVEGIVERASEQDKLMSLYAQQLAPRLLQGQIPVRGQPLLEPGRLSAPALQAWQALLPAITLGLEPEDLAVNPAQAWLGASGLSQQPLDDAYRRAVMVPIALAVSLMFGLANICLLISLVVHRLAPGRVAMAGRRQLAVFVLSWSTLLLISWMARADEVRSQGYREVARPALSATQPLLAPFVEWSLRAQPVWDGTTGWLRESVLGEFAFRRPALIADIEL